MTLNPDHYFDQAERLIAAAVRSRQVDLRRAISSAYYGVFHCLLTCLADEIVGRAQRGTARYTLVYRSVDHGRVKDLCMQVRQKAPAPKYLEIAPAGGFDQKIIRFAAAIAELQEIRHKADYEPRGRFTVPDVHTAIEIGREAVKLLGNAEAGSRSAFLALLLCKPR